MQSAQTWQSYLDQEFKNRKVKNPSYSLRSFARHLAISPTQLSMVLSGKRTLKPKMAVHLTEVLGLTATEMLSLLDEKSETKTSHPSPDNFQVLSLDEFGPIASWQYYAILGLASLRENIADPIWIAIKLNISADQAKIYFEDLIRLKHIAVKAGQFRQISQDTRTKDDLPAQTIRRFHKQMLQIASQKIDVVDVSLREYASMTIPINPRKISSAKKMIRDFKESFSKEMARGQKTEVYDLCIQFFPLSETKTAPRVK